MKLQRFILDDILIDSRINTREIDEKTVAEYQADMLEYGEDTWQSRWKGIPKVTSAGQLWSGFHTLAAARQAFGPQHEIECEVEGDTYHDAFLLATGENADHGRRRTSQEKQEAVERWLRDADGKLWTNNHIAKRCKVSRTVVDNVLRALKAREPGYERPTTLKYINRYGKEAWMETATLATSPRDDDERQPPRREAGAETLEAARETFGTASTALTAAVDAFLAECAAAGLQYRRGYVTRRIHSEFQISMAPGTPPSPELTVAAISEQVAALQRATAALLHNQASDIVAELMEMDQLFAIYAAYEVFKKTLLTEPAQAFKTDMSALLQGGDFEVLPPDERLAHLQRMKSHLAEIAAAEERAQDEAAKQAAQERDARELAAAHQDATASQAELRQAFFAHPEMAATDTAWRAFCHAAAATPEIDGDAKVLATKERLLELTHEEALHYAMRFDMILLALKQDAAWVADFAAAAREKTACHSEPPDVVAPDAAGFQEFLEKTAFPSLLRILTAASDTSRIRLSRTYRMPVTEIEAGIQAFIKPEQDLRKAQHECTQAMEEAKRAFQEHPLEFRVPWVHFVAAAREQKGDALKDLDADAFHSLEVLLAAIPLWQEVSDDITNRAPWVTALEKKQSTGTQPVMQLTPTQETLTCYTDSNNRMWVPMKGTTKDPDALLYYQVAFDENRILTFIKDKKGRPVRRLAKVVK